jgi:hypothetical protein
VTFVPKRINAFYCSHACRQRAYRTRQGTGTPPASERTCLICGVTFVPKRINAIYCSHACQQRAYRIRQGTGTPQHPSGPA